MAERLRLSAELPEITLDLFTSATGIIGLRGSGKTSDGVVIFEEAVRIRVPAIVIDPTGVWYGAKSSADGKSAGLPVYIFGGVHADVPLEPTAGALLARFVVENPAWIVLDLSDLSKSKQRQFVTDFLVALYDLKNRQRDPLLLIIDEAPRFVPQGMMRGDLELAKCIGAVEDAVTLGRSRGLGIVLIGQRAATINKNVLTQVDNLIAMRLTGPSDRKAIDEWISEKADGHQHERDELVQNLPALKTGEGYFWSPSLFGIFRRVHFNRRTTFDSSRTPKIGEKRVEPKVFAKVDLDALRGEIAATVERAKDADPKLLRARIAELERNAAKAGNNITDPAIVTELETRVSNLMIQRDRAVTISKTLYKALAALQKQGEAWLAIAMSALKDAEEEPASDPRPVRGSQPLGRRPEPAIVPARPSRDSGLESTSRPRREGLSDGGNVSRGTISPAQRKVLEALAMRHPTSSTRAQLAAIAGYSPSGGGFANLLGALRTLGLLEYPASGEAILTDAGAELVGDAIGKAPRSSQEIIDFWISRSGSAGRLLRAIVDAHPGTLSRTDLAKSVGMEPTGGGFANYLGKLRGLGLIEYIASGVVRAADELFPTGKPR